LASTLDKNSTASRTGDFVGSFLAWEGEPVEKTANEALGGDGN